MAFFDEDRGILGGLYKGAASTVAGIGTLGQKALQKVTFGLGNDTPTLNESLGDTLKPVSTGEKIGFATEKIAEFLLPSTALAKAQKAATGLIKGANWLSTVGRTATRAGIEAAYSGGWTAAQQGKFDDSTRTAALVSALFPIAGGAYKATRQAAGRAVTDAGESLLTRKLGVPDRITKEGFDITNIKKYGLAKGNLSDMLTGTQNKLHSFYDELTDVLKKAPTENAQINLNELVEQTSKELLETNKARMFGNNLSNRRILEQLKQEVKAVSEDGLVDLMTAQFVKQGAGTKGAWAYRMPDPDSTAIEKVYTAFYGKMKVALENAGGPKVKEINKKLSELIPISHAIFRKIPIENRQQVLSLTDTLGLYASVLNPKALAIAGVNKIAKTTRFANFVIRAGEYLSKRQPKTGVGKRLLGN